MTILNKNVFGICILLLSAVAAAAKSHPSLKDVASVRWCQVLAHYAALDTRDRDRGAPLSDIIEMLNRSGWKGDEKQIMHDIAVEIYATTWDEDTARREIKARCLRETP